MDQELTRSEARVLIDLAGEAAERRAERGATIEWRRQRTPQELVCFHEASHVVVAEALGWFAHWAKVDPITLSGAALVTFTLEAGANSQPSTEGPGPSDSERTYTYCSLLSNDEHWESLRDAFRVQVDAIVERRWLAIAALAGELDRKGVILRPEILRICGAFPTIA